MSHKPKVSIREDQPMQRVRRHRESIERIKNINGILKQSLARESRESRMTANLTTSVEMQKLQEQAEMYHKKIESERRKINKLDRDITDMEYKTLEQRQKMGGVNASKENNMMISKQIKVLENRLDKALVKFNESLAANKQLRQQIDTLRRERVVFDGIYKKLERELHEKRKEMAAIIKDSNDAYQARDKAQNEMLALKAEAERDKQQFEEEWQKLAELLENDRKERERLRLQQLEAGPGTSKAGGRHAIAQPGTAGGPHDEQQRGKVEEEQPAGDDKDYEAEFKKIQEATGMDDIDEIVAKFNNAEEKNFSLFNYVNDLNSEIERLELRISETKSEIEKYKGQGVSTDTQRKKMLRQLEERLARTTAKADEYERQHQQAMKTINTLKQGIQGIFSRIGAGGNSSMEEMLGNQGVTESNIMQYLGLIEQRTSEILRNYAQSQNFGDTRSAALSYTEDPVQTTPSAPLRIQPPTLDDFSSGDDSDQEDDERPLTREELQRKTRRGLERKDAKLKDAKRSLARVK
mmetsp:Transcript_34637/g.43729  ORF Transcript_34637/g.43729 Transcript_34637/m.43729 type:complete len:523 (-) Transcript_34637:275-1843(-)